ncbi:hypothetical protein CDQ91_05660 [Sphingopyxis witflariensis]|uniref:Uncharacterized protein n=2 Tax=Sphingopyxis witflariensis TaxID=173675 RepID=A0A246K3S0_9SPHN|nr:hypothetical protein CDQ91_05660 [Sphingopyxis witflariensis]
MSALGWEAAVHTLDSFEGERMHISERDGTFTVQHVTGPTHNMLRLTVGRGKSQEFVVTVLPPIGECRHHNGLTAQEVAPAILAGLADANAALKTDFIVTAAEIVENDSRRQGIYEYLTRKIIERAAETQRP